jgi:hypothetical protein
MLMLMRAGAVSCDAFRGADRLSTRQDARSASETICSTLPGMCMCLQCVLTLHGGTARAWE